MNREIINDYILQKRNWSDLTKSTARAKLNTLCDIGFIPDKCYTYLNNRDYSRYTIKSYFVIAAGLDVQFSDFLRENSNLFRNAYQSKTDVVKTGTVARILAEATEIDSLTYNLLYLMAFCGLRLSEAESVKWSDVKDQTILTVIGKGEKYREVPVNQSKLVSPTTPSPEAAIAGKGCKARKLLSRHNLTPHSLRAFYITNCVRSGIFDLDEVQKAVGHSSLMTTQRYLRTDINSMVEKFLRSGL